MVTFYSAALSTCCWRSYPRGIPVSPIFHIYVRGVVTHLTQNSSLPILQKTCKHDRRYSPLMHQTLHRVFVLWSEGRSLLEIIFWHHAVIVFGNAILAHGLRADAIEEFAAFAASSRSSRKIRVLGIIWGSNGSFPVSGIRNWRFLKLLRDPVIGHVA